MRMKKHGHETNFSKINFSNIGGIESDLRGSIMGDIMILGKNSLNLNFEHCVNSFLNR